MSFLAFCFIVAFLFLLRKFVVAPSGKYGLVSPVKSKTTQVYNLPRTRAPRLTGFGLRLFTYFVEEPLTRWLILPKLQADVGIHEYRSLHSKYNDVDPTYKPLVSAEPKRVFDNVTTDVEKFLSVLSSTEDNNGGYDSVCEYSSAYVSGKTSPEEVAKNIISLIESQDSKYHAMISWNAEDILKQGKESTVRYKSNSQLSVLDGVPIAIKDEFDQMPFPTTGGTKFLGIERKVAQDSSIVKNLRKLGALLIGKANMHEIGMGTTGFNRHHETARNPHNINCYTGGSSSGSACAVAAGYCPAAVGADGGGSIRIPAALCGVVGLKPTFGRVSEHGALPLCATVAHAGPIAASVQDTTLLYAALAGPDPQCHDTSIQPQVSIPTSTLPSMAGLRVGIFRDYFTDADSEIVSHCEQCLSVFQDKGAVIKDIAIPNLFAMKIAHAVTIMSEMNTCMNAFPSKLSQPEYAVRITLAMARSLTSSDYVLAQKVRTEAIATMKAIFEEVDVIVTPGTGLTAPEIADDVLPEGESDIVTVTNIMRFAFLANFTGIPAIVFPVGFDSSKKPTSIQLMSSWWSEDLLLNCARFYEASAPTSNSSSNLVPLKPLTTSLLKH